MALFRSILRKLVPITRQSNIPNFSKCPIVFNSPIIPQFFSTNQPPTPPTVYSLLKKHDWELKKTIQDVRYENAYATAIHISVWLGLLALFVSAVKPTDKSVDSHMKNTQDSLNSITFALSTFSKSMQEQILTVFGGVMKEMGTLRINLEELINKVLRVMRENNEQSKQEREEIIREVRVLSALFLEREKKNEKKETELKDKEEELELKAKELKEKEDKLYKKEQELKAKEEKWEKKEEEEKKAKEGKKAKEEKKEEEGKWEKEEELKEREEPLKREGLKREKMKDQREVDGNGDDPVPI